jgi:hypothetical protein
MSHFSLLSTLFKITTLVISLSFISSCKKTKIAGPQTVFSFKANGMSYKWSNNVSSSTEPQGAKIIKITTATGNISYILEGIDHQSDMFLNLAMVTNTLQKTIYTTITPSSNNITYSIYKANNVYGAPVNPGDSVAVNITDITNNFATGTFNAVMHDQTLTKIEITEGSFQHVMIVQ